ncbi:pyroglutamyl-peptidase I [Paenarthrobacter sp. NPDC089989]|uniref:pyroglutamyl-peptidase I n=1 Tax=unclassified Paenarthrobacter TaxID=2634190 RepID=UPI00381D657B
MILLTGFEPFGGDSTNPSWTAVLQAARMLRAEGLTVETVELPCVFGESVDVLIQAIEAHQPELVLSVGLAGGRSRISLERVAINCDDARIPDNKGNRPIDQEVVPGGPAAYFCTLPIKSALRSLQIEGIKGEVSQSAGTYVCNHVFYALMHALKDRAGTRGGFVHVPYASEDLVQGSTAPSMPVESMARGIAVVVRTAAQTGTDAKLSAGAIH